MMPVYLADKPFAEATDTAKKALWEENMKRILTVALLLWACASACNAGDTAATKDDLAAAEKLQEVRLDGLEKLRQKDLEALRELVARVDKRVDDQLTQVGQGVDRFSAQTAWTSILITVLVVLGGFMGYRNAKAEAKEEAKKAAKEQADESAKQWFETNAVNLKRQIKEFETNAAKINKELAQKISQTHQQMDDAVKQTQNKAISLSNLLDIAQSTLNTRKIEPTQDNQIEKNKNPTQEKIIQHSDELKKRSENSYTFNDWNARAHAAYSSDQLEDAAYFWRKAAEFPGIEDEKIAQTLVNRGVALEEIGMYETAISIFNEVEAKFGNTDKPELREQTTWALLNKGIALGKSQNYEAAIKTSDRLLEQLSSGINPVPLEILRLTFNNKGYYCLEQAKFMDRQTMRAKELLNTALASFDQAIERGGQNNGTFLCNKAYALHLLGNTGQAKAVFSAALRAPINGGRFLYESAIEYLEKQPGTKDDEARKMVELAWTAYSLDQSNGQKEPPNNLEPVPTHH